MEKKLKNELTANAILCTLFIIGGIDGTIYFNYPMWSWVGLGAGIYI